MQKKHNTLSQEAPQLLSEWHPTLNDTLTPYDVTSGSAKKVWWICGKGHTWQASIANRAKGRGCPVCAGKQILKGFNDLASQKPDLAVQWHQVRNGDLSPESVTISSGKKVWWQCEKNHEWRAVVASRTAGVGCPVCAGKKVQKGYNDLETVNPELARQWHPEKNGALTPEQVTKGSGKKVWWQCEKGHEWQAVISSRSSGVDCPKCTPHGTSFAEQALFFYIRQLYHTENRYRFKKKQIDIYLLDYRIGIEHDGRFHHLDDVKGADARKDALLEKNDIYLIRVKDLFPQSVDEENAIIYYTHNVEDFSALEWAIGETIRLISQRTNNKNTVSIDVARDETAIRSQYQEYELEHSIFAKCKESQAYCDWEKNRVNPWYVTYGSGYFVNWKCKLGHQWTSRAANFYRGGRCPTCSGRKTLARFNDLASIRPDLAAQWHPTRNGDLKPNKVTLHAGKKVWWQCEKGHEWQAVVASRSNGAGCAVCSGKRLLSGFNDLKTRKPELATQWHPEKNGELIPDQITSMSNKKVWWRCEHGHEWMAAVGSRTRGNGCPYCSGRRAIKGETDLATVHPDLAAQWHPTQNGDLKPDDVLPMSDQKIWWMCKSGHSWKTTVSNRTQGKGCPYCAGRLAIKGYNDLGTVNPKLAHEWHYAKNRELTPGDVTQWSNKNVWWICKKKHEWQAVIGSRTAGRGCPVCGGKKVLAGFNDLATVAPDLAAQWHPTRNGILTPDMVTAGSGKKVWWQCEKGHEWQAGIASRSQGTDCPVCASRKLLSGYNDFATAHPEVVREWHPWRNGDLLPQDVAVASHNKVWWQCEKRHEWQASLADRSRGYGCPYCSGKWVIAGENDLATVNPTLAGEWHPTNNGSLTPWDVKPYSNKKVWWRCESGHEWQATVNSRSAGNGCAQCSGRRVIVGETDLATTNPELAKQWNWDKNKALTPRDVTKGSDKLVWWVCEKGHKWQARVGERSRGQGCPICSGNRIERGYNDLATTKPELAREWHPTRNEEKMPDSVSAGSNCNVWWLCSKGHEWQAPVSRRSRGGGCPICAGKRVLPGYNDLATCRPELVAQWHTEKNGALSPHDLTQNSGKKVWWLCEKGHIWEASVDARVRGSGCPVCAGKKVVAGINDIATTDPELARQWHPAQNGSLQASEVTRGSGKKAWWLCEKGHEWQAIISNRAKGVGCPTCAKEKDANKPCCK